jgi:hypothetical protein
MLLMCLCITLLAQSLMLASLHQGEEGAALPSTTTKLDKISEKAMYCINQGGLRQVQAELRRAVHQFEQKIAQRLKQHRSPSTIADGVSPVSSTVNTTHFTHWLITVDSYVCTM